MKYQSKNRLEPSFLQKAVTALCLLAACSVASFAQSYSDKFYDAMNADDLPAQRQALAEWELAAPNDVDLYIARYNFYVNAGSNEVVMIDADEPTEESFVIKTDSGDFYMHSVMTFDEKMADSGLFVIAEAIKAYPNRLDLRFGEIYFLGQLERWDAFADAIVRTIDHSSEITHLWTFPNVDGGGVELMTEGVLDYQAQMLETIPMDNLSAEDSAMVLRMRRVAERMVKAFPRDVPSVNLLSVTYTIFKDYENSIKYLLRAEKMAPNDEIVLSNLASVYNKMGKKKQAKQYETRLEQLQASAAE